MTDFRGGNELAAFLPSEAVVNACTRCGMAEEKAPLRRAPSGNYYCVDYATTGGGCDQRHEAVYRARSAAAAVPPSPPAGSQLFDAFKSDLAAAVKSGAAKSATVAAAKAKVEERVVARQNAKTKAKAESYAALEARAAAAQEWWSFFSPMGQWLILATGAVFFVVCIVVAVVRHEEPSGSTGSTRTTSRHYGDQSGATCSELQSAFNAAEARNKAGIRGSLDDMTAADGQLRSQGCYD